MRLGRQVVLPWALDPRAIATFCFGRRVIIRVGNAWVLVQMIGPGEVFGCIVYDVEG